ncbi:HU family DNA-binding protein [Bacteroides sp.]|uniref:HU family DNA-binding protein n=1 Tax=Bacteroides sp. TaxID=29523 RepID=UPI002FCB7E55
MNERFYMQDLVDLLVGKHCMDKKDADAFVREFFLLIEEALEYDRYVKIKGLGTFKLIDVDSRESVNVNTGERFEIQGHTKVSFTPDTALRDLINRPFAHFETVVLNENTILEDTPIDESDDEAEEEVEEEAVEEITLDPINEEIVSSEELPLETVAEVAVNSISDTLPDPLPEVDPEVVAEEMVSEAVINEVSSQEQLSVEKGSTLTAEQIIALELQKTSSIKSVSSEKGSIKPVVMKSPAGKKEIQSRGNSPTSYLIVIILLTLLLCGGAILFMYYPDLFVSDTSKEVPSTTVAHPVAKKEVLLDTMVVVKDTVAESIPETKTLPVESIDEKNEHKKEEAKTETKTSTNVKPAVPVKPDSLTYKIVGTKATHVVQEGETLTRVSLRFYGTKAFWPYIVKYNQDIIKNPDNVPYGTKLKIPELVKK